MNFDLRQSEKYADYMEHIGWQVEKLNGCQVFIRKIPFLPFSIIKIQRPNKISPSILEEVDKLAKQHHALFVKLEPISTSRVSRLQMPSASADGGQAYLTSHGYLLDKSPLLPTKTRQLDLTLSEKDIFSRFSKDGRYEIRKAQFNKVVVQKSQNIELFANVWQQNALKRGFWLPFKKEIKSIYGAFGENAYLILSYLSDPDKPLAGVLILINNQIASYFYACSSPEGRKLSAPSLIVWEAIKLAKSKGCQIFDFEGIYDERFPNKSWLGFTHFKKSFGGQEVVYPGCFTKIYHPFLRFIPI